MSRQPAPDARPVTLTIAGSDSGGGAGIQADIKTMEAHGAFATSVITAVTAQNTRGVESSFVLPIDEIEAQLDAVLNDFDVRAVKTGMLASTQVIELVTQYVAELSVPVVVDPVMVAAAGDRLLDVAAEDTYPDLIREATLVTPNVPETEVLTGIEVTDQSSAEKAVTRLLALDVQGALVKGGHISGEQIIDVFREQEGTKRVFTHPRIETDATHGSGCTISSAVAARLAMTDSLSHAVESSVSFMERAVRYPLDVGEGPGSVHHLVSVRDRAAREPTAESVEEIVAAFVDADVSPLVPEVGMNVVGATPYAENARETAAVEGRITRVFSGVNPNKGVRFGASSHVARFLLAAREFEPRFRYAVNCRFTSAIEAALTEVDGVIGEFDRSQQPPDIKNTEGSTMEWGARQVFEGTEEFPVAIIDRGEVGKEAIVKLLAEDPGTLINQTLSVREAV